MTRRALFLALLGLGLLSPLTSSARTRKQVDKTPAYTMRALYDGAGKRTSLAEQAPGQLLVVVVIKGTWCPVCVAQLQRLSKLQRQLDARNTRVVALTSEPPAQIGAAQKRLPFKLLNDPKHLVLQRLGLWRPRWNHAQPAIVVFDRCGKERRRVEGRAPAVRVERSLFRVLDELLREKHRCKLLTA